MRYFKEAYSGIILLVGIMIINVLVWMLATPLFEQPIESIVGQVMASNIIILLSFTFFLSTRNRLVDFLFHGLENVYLTHRVLALLILSMIFIHAQFASMIFSEFREPILITGRDAGIWARNLFLFLIAFALLAKYMKYEVFRNVHRLMIFPYLLAVYHAINLSSFEILSVSWLGTWMLTIVAVGTLSSLYMLLFYRHIAFKYSGVIESVEKLNDTVTEVTLRVPKDFAFKTGQFVFLKIKKKPFNNQPHPFSISSYQDNQITFSIKALGDFTEAIQSSLQKDDKVTFTQAYGHMTFDDYPSPQVWIAGGIGITPFLSHLRTTEKPSQAITLYYSVKTLEDSVHLAYLKELDKSLDHFTLKLSESDKDGFLSTKDLEISKETIVFMCGPVVMAKALKKDIKKNYPDTPLIYEAFSFTGTLVQDIVTFFNKTKNKIIKKKPS